jgi:DNA replication initiation complex subunit (GINS family)
MIEASEVKTMPISLSEKFDINDAYDKEITMDGLQYLPPNFYERITNTFNQLLDAKKNCHNRDQEYFIKDQLNNLIVLMDGICDRRTSKIVELAVLNGSGAAIDTMNILTPESELYDAIKIAIINYNNKTLAIVREKYRMV